MTKNQANANKQHTEAQNYSHSSFILPSKNSRTYTKNKQNNKFFIHDIMRLTIMKMKMKIKNKLHRRDISRHRSKRGHNIVS